MVYAAIDAGPRTLQKRIWISQAQISPHVSNIPCMPRESTFRSRPRLVDGGCLLPTPSSSSHHSTQVWARTGTTIAVFAMLRARNGVATELTRGCTVAAASKLGNHRFNRTFSEAPNTTPTTMAPERCCARSQCVSIFQMMVAGTEGKSMYKNWFTNTPSKGAIAGESHIAMARRMVDVSTVNTNDITNKMRRSTAMRSLRPDPKA
mmetsp:Transcript_80678/g.261483  ORF Transcript_80678/g.261483 Transcript_80678/m.261483 type:complete len:206 (-) Transcript_80678:225-842(-)